MMSYKQSINIKNQIHQYKHQIANQDSVEVKDCRNNNKDNRTSITNTQDYLELYIESDFDEWTEDKKEDNIIKIKASYEIEKLTEGIKNVRNDRGNKLCQDESNLSGSDITKSRSFVGIDGLETELVSEEEDNYFRDNFSKLNIATNLHVARKYTNYNTNVKKFKRFWGIDGLDTEMVSEDGEISEGLDIFHTRFVSNNIRFLDRLNNSGSHKTKADAFPRECSKDRYFGDKDRNRKSRSRSREKRRRCRRHASSSFRDKEKRRRGNDEFDKDRLPTQYRSFSRSRRSSEYRNRNRVRSRSRDRFRSRRSSSVVSQRSPRLHGVSSRRHVLSRSRSLSLEKHRHKKKCRRSRRYVSRSNRSKSRSPLRNQPDKDMYASGDNILVRVSLNKNKHSRFEEHNFQRPGSKNKDNKSKKSKTKQKEKYDRRSKKRHLTNRKPIAIIDLVRSPYKEMTPSPGDMIIVTDSDSDVQEINFDRGVESIRNNSQGGFSLCNSISSVAMNTDIISKAPQTKIHGGNNITDMKSRVSKISEKPIKVKAIENPTIIIDLLESPIKELTLRPQSIVLTDSDTEGKDFLSKTSGFHNFTSQKQYKLNNVNLIPHQSEKGDELTISKPLQSTKEAITTKKLGSFSKNIIDLTLCDSGSAQQNILSLQRNSQPVRGTTQLRNHNSVNAIDDNIVQHTSNDDITITFQSQETDVKGSIKHKENTLTVNKKLLLDLINKKPNATIDLSKAPFKDLPASSSTVIVHKDKKENISKEKEQNSKLRQKVEHTDLGSLREELNDVGQNKSNDVITIILKSQQYCFDKPAKEGEKSVVESTKSRLNFSNRKPIIIIDLDKFSAKEVEKENNIASVDLDRSSSSSRAIIVVTDSDSEETKQNLLKSLETMQEQSRPIKEVAQHENSLNNIMNSSAINKISTELSFMPLSKKHNFRNHKSKSIARSENRNQEESQFKETSSRGTIIVLPDLEEIDQNLMRQDILNAELRSVRNESQNGGSISNSSSVLADTGKNKSNNFSRFIPTFREHENCENKASNIEQKTTEAIMFPNENSTIMDRDETQFIDLTKPSTSAFFTNSFCERRVQNLITRSEDSQTVNFFSFASFNKNIHNTSKDIPQKNYSQQRNSETSNKESASFETINHVQEHNFGYHRLDIKSEIDLDIVTIIE